MTLTAGTVGMRLEANGGFSMLVISHGLASFGICTIAHNKTKFDTQPIPKHPVVITICRRCLTQRNRKDSCFLKIRPYWSYLLRMLTICSIKIIKLLMHYILVNFTG